MFVQTGCLKKKELSAILNLKYEVTDFSHEEYPFLHRIRALRDIGDKVKTGDLGGFVESERNLSFEPGDDAWIFDDAIVCGDGYVDKGSRLFGESVVCDRAYLSQGSEMSGQTRAEDDAYLRGAALCGHARASGHSVLVTAREGAARPILSENCAVYGIVQGDVHVMGTAVIVNGENIFNDTPDILIVKDTGRAIIRDPARDKLFPCKGRAKLTSKKERGCER